MRSLRRKLLFFFNLFLEKAGGIDPANYRGVCMEKIEPVENIVDADISLYEIDIVEGSIKIDSSEHIKSRL